MDELANELEVPPKKVENMIQVARRPLSLETPTDDEEDSVLGDFIEDDEASRRTIRVSLPPREVRILQLRYGLLDGQAYTLEEVGRKMGVTRERVRQIEAQALSTRQSIRSRGVSNERYCPKGRLRRNSNSFMQSL